MRVRAYERQAGIAPLPRSQAVPILPAGDSGLSAGQVVGNIAARLQQIQNDTEDARTLELFNRYKQDSTAYHEDPDSGIYHTRLGYQSQGLYRDADQWMRTKGEEYANQLTSNRAKSNFRRLALEHIQAQGLANSRFEAEQTKKYRIETAQATIRNNLAQAEQNWDNPQAIAQARSSISQALELQMRGSGQEAFTNAYMEIENQIGMARIRQAYTKDPLLAVSMLDDPDIKLKPETRAQLAGQFSQLTEIYEVHAVSQEYAKHYTPENAVALSDTLNRRYGPEKAPKIFAAIQRIWGIRQAQDAARQQSNADMLARSLINPNARKFSREQVIAMMEGRNIDPNTANHYINYLDAIDKADQKAQDDAAKNYLWAIVNNGKEFTDEEYSRFAMSWGREFANSLQAQQKEKQNERRQAARDAQTTNAGRYIERFIRNDYPTRKEIVKAVQDKTITPEKGQSFIGLIDAREKEQEKAQEQQRIDTQKANASSMLGELINGSLTEERVRQAIGGEISPEQGYALLNHLRTENERQAKQAKSNRDDELYNLAENYSRQFFTGHEQEFYDTAKSLDMPPEDKRKLTEYYNTFISQQKTGQANRKKESEEFSFGLYSLIKLQYEEAKSFDDFLPDEQLQQMFIDGDLEPEQYDHLRQQKKNFEAEQLRKAKEKAKDDRKRYADGLLIEAIKGKNPKSIEYLQSLVQNDVIDYSVMKEVLSIQDKQAQARTKADEEFRRDRNYDTAKDLASRFPEGQQQGAYDEINRLERIDAQQVAGFYEQFISQQRTINQNNKKAEIEQQNKNYDALLNDYWRQMKPVPNDVLLQLERTEGLSQTQLDQARTMNISMDTRSGIEKMLYDTIPDFAVKSRNEREALIMQYMGTTEDVRKRNVAYLFQMALNDTLTDARLDWDVVHGRIGEDDRENLKSYNAKFERAQRTILSNTAKQLIMNIREAGIHLNSSKYENEALTDFYRVTSTFDLHAKNFNEAVENAYKSVVNSILGRYGDTITKTRGIYPVTWLTDAEKRRQNALSTAENFSLPQPNPQLYYEDANEQGMFISPQGDTSDFSNVIDIPAPPQTPDVPPRDYTREYIDSNPYLQRITSTDAYSQTDSNTLQGVQDISKAVVSGDFRVSSQYSTQPSKLRDGRAHRAVDIAVPENTELRTPNTGTSWTVTKTGENDTAGKHITISTTLASGDKLDVTLAHLNSFDVANGDVIASGDVVAMSGNTGHSTGPHVHVSTKLNGVTVNPQSVDLGTSADIQPQPLVQPVVSSDAEYYQAALSVLQTLFSNDMFNNIDYGGY